MLHGSDSFTVYIETKDSYVNISKYVETRFYTSTYGLERPLLRGQNKKNYWINERWIRRRKIMLRFVALNPKAYTYFIDDGDEYKEVKFTKRWVVKQNKYKNCKSCLQASQLENETNLLKNDIEIDNLREIIKNW